MKINFYFILLSGVVGQYPYKYPCSISCIGGQIVFGVRPSVQNRKPLKTNDLRKAFGRGAEKKCVQKWCFSFTEVSFLRKFAGQTTKNSLFFLRF